MLAFLEDVLVGDTGWRLSDVRRLVELQALISIGRSEADGFEARTVAEAIR